MSHTQAVAALRLPNAGSAITRAGNEPSRSFTITEKATIRAFSWFKLATTLLTFNKNLIRHYAKQALR